jgi:hypothetical protein
MMKEMLDAGYAVLAPLCSFANEGVRTVLS